MKKVLLIAAILATAIVMVANLWAIDVKNDAALVGLWLFDDGSGTAVKDSSGKNNNGTITGTYTWATGKFGGCIVAPGTGSINVAKSASLDTVTKAMTLAGWFRVDTASDTGIRRPNAYLLEDQSDTEAVPDSFSFRIWTTAGLSPGIYGQTKLTQKQWYHVAGTYDGAQMKLYINGVAEKEVKNDAKAVVDGKWNGNIGTPADALQLKYSSESFTGGMDEIALFSRALSETEIKELMVGALNPNSVESPGKLSATWAAIKR